MNTKPTTIRYGTIVVIAIQIVFGEETLAVLVLVVVAVVFFFLCRRHLQSTRQADMFSFSLTLISTILLFFICEL